MKHIIFICVISFLIPVYLPAQTKANKGDRDLKTEKSLLQKHFSDKTKYNYLKKSPRVTLRDSFSLDKTFRMQFSAVNSMYLNNLARHKFDIDLNRVDPKVDFSFKLPPKPVYYFSVYDYTPSYTFKRYSPSDCPLDRSPRDLYFSCSGNMIHFTRIGYSGAYIGNSTPAYFIQFFRKDKRIVGFDIIRAN